MAHTYRYARAALTVDCVVFGFDGVGLKVLLIRRGLAPFAGQWALPGGFVRVEEELEMAARRELLEETGVRRVFLEQLGVFGAVNRDPRERVISVAFTALVKPAEHPASADTDAVEAQWFPADSPPGLAFDHTDIVAAARSRLRRQLRHAPVGFELLPSNFTLSELQTLYEAVLGRTLDKRNFRKKVLALDLLRPEKDARRHGSHRPAQLFRFDVKRYEQLATRGMVFEL